MRYTLALSLFCLFTACNLNRYTQLWNSVTYDAEGEQAVKALRTVKYIYQKALASEDIPNQARAAIVIAHFSGRLSNDKAAAEYKVLDSLILLQKGVVKAILLSRKAELLQEYCKEQQYNINDRAILEEDSSRDIREWDKGRFERTIPAVYLASLQDTAVLQEELLSRYEGLLTQVEENRHLRPTVYDLLAHRALNYFNLYAGDYNDTLSFAPADVFTHSRIKDNGLEIYGGLIRFHQRKNNLEAMVQADLERLEYAYNHTRVVNKDSLYKQALEHLLQKHTDNRIGTSCAFQLADYYYKKAARISDTAIHNSLYRNAMRLCEEGSSIFTDTDGNKKCLALKNILLQKELKLRAESVNEPAKPFRVLVNYRNMHKLYFRLFRVGQKMDFAPPYGERDNKAGWDRLLTLPVQKSWQQSLVDPLDYTEHTTEVKVDALETGKYLLIASDNEHFDYNMSRMSALIVRVSNISYITTDDVDYYALHRSTGAPLQGVKLVLKSGQAERIFTTDKTGLVQVNYPREWQVVPVALWINGSDTLHTDDGAFLSDSFDNMEEEEEVSVRTYYFSDRKIYRPEQTICFKGIRTKGEGANNKIMPATPVKVWLIDDNDRKIDSLNFRTNSFGSFSGSFKLPAGLTGSFRIEDDGDEGQLYINVEEYKRPKFEVTFDAVKDTWKVYDSVRVKGHAIVYAGNNLSHTKVNWKVLRKSVYQNFMDYVPFTMEERIAGNVTTTDAAGNFELTFVAIPDQNVKADQQVMFTYEITADVTDANGETRTGTTDVLAGFQKILLTTNFDKEVKPSELKALRIGSHNANGAFIPTPVKITLTRLMHPGKLRRPAYWERPDQFVMTEKEYHGYFPLDVYKNENDPATWPKGKRYKQNGMTGENKKWDFSQAGSGYYELVITGKDMIKKQIIEVPDKERNAGCEYTWYFDYDKKSQPGDVAHITLGVSGTTWLLQQAAGSSAISTRKLTGKLVNIDVPIKESDRGNKSVTLAYVKDNRLFSYDLTIKVPWSNKNLGVAIATHRNKLLPGQKETWQITVKGPAAELTATMYDASLDEFSKLDWEVPPFYEDDYYTTRWKSGSNFSANFSIDKMTQEVPYPKRYKDFDKLMEAKQEEGIYGVASMMVANAESDTDFKYEANARADGLTVKLDQPNPPPAAPRKDFRETAFFIPQLQINGRGSISFTMPEALTKWKFLAFAHTKDLRFGLASTEVITQKPLMVVPNVPRFLREGDNVELSTRISNVTNAALSGKAKLELLDPDTRKPLNASFSNISSVRHFTAGAGQSTAVSFQLKVPQGYLKPLVYRITAESGNFTDGEEALLPILSNKILVTESMPMHIRGSGKKQYTFEKLRQSSNSQTLQHQGVTVTYNSFPIWYAIQSLPYLMEFPHECAEQTFSRYYANVVATQILKSSANIRAAVKRLDVTPLEKESPSWEETPWLKEAQSENHLAALMDLERMSQESNKAYKQLEAMQLPNGGFPWFGGMEANDYITRLILTGIGRLKVMKVAVPDDIVKKGMKYLESNRRKEMAFDSDDLHYLYMRSFFPEYTTDKSLINKVVKNWMKRSVYEKGMTALILFRYGNKTAAKKIMQHLKENATQSEEMGMYWTSVESGYYWYEAPVEIQSLLIEAFATITNDKPAVDALKTWLLKQKQTNSWSTTRSTADACYALLMSGTDWLEAKPEVKITIGEETLTDKTGILKTRFEEKKISPKMGKVALEVKGNTSQPSWGAVYWQYFEQLDKITPSKSGLSIQRELYLEKNGALSRITAAHPLHVGDKVTMRIILKADRNMEFVHLKDMRPACLEPINVLSGYRMGYYESTKDLATHFFFDRIKKGVQVLEYSLFVSHVGRYAGGISAAQCMYAPEFSTNSAGMNVVVE